MAADSSETLLPDPFALTPDPAVYLPRPATEAALVEVLRSVNKPQTRTALIGPPGLGKTLMLHLIAVRAADKFKTVYLPYAALPPEELCAWALNLLGAPETSDPVVALCSAAKRLRERGFPLLLTVDDGGAMPVATARWMGDVLTDSGGALRLLIAASDQASINRTLAAIGGEFDVVRLSVPMSEAETQRYIEGRLTRARVPSHTRKRFDSATVRELHRLSAGIPRRLHTAAAAVLHGDRRSGWIDLDPVLEELLSGPQSADRTPPAARVKAESPGTTLETPQSPAKAPSNADPKPAVADELTEGAPSFAGGELGAAPSLAPPPLRRIEPPPSRAAVLLGVLLIAGLTVAIPLIRSLLPEPVRQAAVANSGPIESRPPELAPRNPAGEEPVQAAVLPDPGPNSVPAVEGALGPFSVHVNATPWASVRVDGIDLGATPIANIPLLAGSHSFTAQMSDGRVIERVVEIDAENRFVGFE